MNQPVQKRAVFFIGGYEPKSPEVFFQHLAKQLSRFDALWGCRSDLAPVELTNDGEIGTVAVETSGSEESWSTHTNFIFLSLDKIVLADFARPRSVRLLRYLHAFADFVISGAALRFFAKAWRFGLYFLYPFLTLAVFALAGCLLAVCIAPWIGLWGCLFGLLVFALALTLLGERWSIYHLMDLWSFSLEFIRGKRVDADELLRRFAVDVVERVRSGNYDEVILVGHSTGGMLMIDVAARCLAIDDAFAGAARKVVLLTLGSTALKAGYHPAGRNFRMAVERLVDNGELEWVEIQCLTDPINFYKTDPVAEMGFVPKKAKAFPRVRTVRVKDMVQSEIYARIKRNLFRVHYQYVYSNSKRYWYDFFQICCGPIFLSQRLEDRDAGELPAKEATFA